MPVKTDKWYEVTNINEVTSPSILIYPERIEQNIRKMIGIAGSTERLRPHVKTHKMPAMISLQMKHGISKFKCATISEAEMTAECGARDILLAMQPVGPNLGRFFSLRSKFPQASISCIADDAGIIEQISAMAVRSGLNTNVWLDINCGMNRTGIIPGDEAADLFALINSSPGLVATGLHVYDGHIHEPGLSRRQQLCKEAFAPVDELIAKLKSRGFGNINMVAGGTPSFPVHAARMDAELSPGTLLLWDQGYSESFADLDFLCAAVLLTRVVSKPAEDLLCLDLGHKAVASEMPHPRVFFPDLQEYSFTGHNEEHLVIRTSQAAMFRTGDHLYGLPFHICPTIDRHDKATVIIDNKASGEWMIEARKRKITI